MIVCSLRLSRNCAPLSAGIERPHGRLRSCKSPQSRSSPREARAHGANRKPKNPSISLRKYGPGAARGFPPREKNTRPLSVVDLKRLTQVASLERDLAIGRVAQRLAHSRPGIHRKS
jgi:hypothetical protein